LGYITILWRYYHFAACAVCGNTAKEVQEYKMKEDGRNKKKNRD